MMSARTEAIKTARLIVNNPQDYCIVDTETSGFPPKGEVIEFAAIDPQVNLLAHHYILPKEDIHPRAQAVHGLSIETLIENKARTWFSYHGMISSLFETRTLVAFNSDFDVRAIKATADRYRLSMKIDKHICLMKLQCDFTGQGKQKLMGGDHTAYGDCLAALDLLIEIASAELPSDEMPNEATLPSPSAPLAAEASDLEPLCDRLEEIAAEKRQLAEEEAYIKGLITGWMDLEGREAMALPNGKEASFGSNIVGIKPLVPIEDLPPEFWNIGLKKTAIEEAISKGDDLSSLLSWSMSRFLKIK